YTGPGVLTAFADNSIYITEVTYDGANSNTLRVLKAKATTGNVRLTVPDLLSQGQDLVLVDAGKILSPGTEQTVDSSNDHADISAGLDVLLRVGDNVTTTAASVTTAGHNITIFGDYQNLDLGYGTIMHLFGTIAPGPVAGGYLTRIFGNAAADTIIFEQPQLGPLKGVGGRPRPYGSNPPPPAGTYAPAGDDEDTFTVNQLQSMYNIAAGNT